MVPPSVPSGQHLGPSPSGAPIVITDDLPVGFAFVEATSILAACAAVGQVVTWRSVSSVAVGQVVRMDVKVKAAVGRSIVNNASVTGDSMFGASIASDPVLPSDDASTAASVVAVTLPATGWSLVKQWLEAATWLLLLGGFTLVIGRRRHPTPMF